MADEVGHRLPARVRIMGWVLLLMAVALVTVNVMSYGLLTRAETADVLGDLNQEIQEFAGVAGQGVDRATGLPFAGTEQLLFNHILRQEPDENAVLLGLVLRPEGGPRVIPQTTPEPFPLSRRPDLLDRIVAAPSRTGALATEAGELRWAKIDVSTGSPTDRGVYLVAELLDREQAEVTGTMYILAAVSLVGLLLTGGAAWLVSGQILEPVRLVRRAAAQITEQDLSRRIPVRGRDDIAALTRQFNAMLDRLETAFATQREFVDDAGHELRTPITIIRGHLELMGDDPADRDATLRIVSGELDRMGRIVEDLLLLAKSDRLDFVRLERTSVPELTSDIDAKVRALADRRWVLESVGEDDRADLDPQRVTQAMVQLAQNAVQHTGVGDEIRIGSALHTGEDERPWVSFWVADSGPGVPAGDVAAIFQRFSRGTGPSDRGPGAGAGLGLAIVRAIAEAHGGTVRVESPPGAGATFTVGLPARAATTGRGRP
ncbi:sensor histidine kinase [Pseudonocardia sp. C8]|uniref:sensor histidine kinase n=1 Tax=Pseudonocardia sp. C8 TaxID=2762759 RepID=UPI00351C666F